MDKETGDRTRGIIILTTHARGGVQRTSKQAWRGERDSSYEVSSMQDRELESHAVSILLICGWVRNA